MKLLIRLWLAAQAIVAPGPPLLAQTYPTTPVLTVVPNSPISCGIRMYAPGQVQTYCFYNNPPAALVTLCNHLDALPSVAGDATIELTGFQSCGPIDRGGQMVYSIDWNLWVRASVTEYQITFQAMPCAPPTTTNPGAAWVIVCNGVTLVTAGPPSTLVTGTMQ